MYNHIRFKYKITTQSIARITIISNMDKKQIITGNSQSLYIFFANKSSIMLIVKIDVITTYFQKKINIDKVIEYSPNLCMYPKFLDCLILKFPLQQSELLHVIWL